MKKISQSHGEVEQATKTVATEIELDHLETKLFYWRQYISFNRIKMFIAYWIIFKTNQKGPPEADDQVEEIFFWLV